MTTNYIDIKLHECDNFEDLSKIYTTWAETYDDDMSKPDSYNGFVIVSKLLDLYTFRNKNRTILDIGAGTGLVGNELRKLGYKNIDALEPNEAMRLITIKKNLYNKYFTEIVSPDEALTTISENSYDRITAAGCFSQGHMDYRHIKQLIKLLKPGGYLIFGFRYSYVENSQKDVIPEIKRLENEKILKVTLITEVPDYYPGVSGFMTVLIKL